MSDRVIGIAVLDRYCAPQKLWIMCETLAARFQGTRMEDISVHAAGTPKLCNPSWTYRIEGNVLHMAPSVWVRCQMNLPDQTWTDIFHNEGSWSIPFIDCPQGSDAKEMFKAANNAKPHRHE